MPSHKNSPRSATNAPRAKVQADGPDDTQNTASMAAEAALLGCMILSTEARHGAIGMLTADDFEREAHRTMFLALDTMHAFGEAVDQITVNDKLAGLGKLDEVGGLAAVFELTDPTACPSPAAWPTYATIVAREGRRRRGIRVLRRAIARLEAGEDPAVVAAELEVAA